MKVRRIERRDRPRLEAILYAQDHFKSAEVEAALDFIDITLTQPHQRDYTILCAESGSGEVQGYVCYGPTPLTDRVYDLYWIAVNPAFWNRGTGSALLRRMEEELARRRARMVLIETSSLPTYESPRTFYEKHGYREQARVPNFYAAGEHKLIFSKPLPGEKKT